MGNGCWSVRMLNHRQRLRQRDEREMARFGRLARARRFNVKSGLSPRNGGVHRNAAPDWLRSCGPLAGIRDLRVSGREAELLHPPPERHGADVERLCRLASISAKSFQRALD